MVVLKNRLDKNNNNDDDTDSGTLPIPKDPRATWQIL